MAMGLLLAAVPLGIAVARAWILVLNPSLSVWSVAN